MRRPEASPRSVVGEPAWARWSDAAAASPWTIGIEEEVMLLDSTDWTLAARIEDVLGAIDESLADHVGAETHGSALELRTGVHATVADGVAELRMLRRSLDDRLEPLGLRAAAAGLHPSAVWQDTEISAGARYQLLHGSMRELARREPTFALHVHVALPDRDAALRAFNRMRAHVPLLLALSANSPFWQGRDTGLSSARTPLFQGFPRVGIPRAFDDYAAYVESIDLLLRCDAFPEPTFLWWDVRLQPRFATLEIRIMDAQTRLEPCAGLVALVQCLVRLEVLEGFVPPELVGAPEVLDENRFLAARDGVEAALIDPVAGRRIRLVESLPGTLDALRGHAEDLGCAAELELVGEIVAQPADRWQRRVADGADGVDGLAGLVAALAAAF